MKRDDRFRRGAHAVARGLATMMIGIGAAILLRTMLERGSGLQVGYLVGPALIVAGIARLKLAPGADDPSDRGGR